MEPLLRRELSPAALFASRTAAACFTALLLVVYLRWLPHWFERRHGEAAAAAGRDDLLANVLSTLAIGASLLSAAVWFGLAALMFVKRSRDLLGMVLALAFISLGVLLTDLPVIVYMARDDAWAPLPAVVLLIGNAFCIPWVYLFPDGRFVPRWTIFLAAAWVAWSLLRMITPEADQARIGLPGILLNAAFQTSALGAFLYRYFTASDEVQRQQLKWIALGGLIILAALLVVVPSRYLVAELGEGGSAFALRAGTAAFLAIASTVLPALIAVAIFRQGLFHIDLLLNRTLSYLAVTVILAVVFAALGFLLARVFRGLFGEQSEIGLLAAAIPTALAFMPVRAWVLSVADRYVTDRTVRTLLFIDLVDSTRRAAALGDQEWRLVLDRFRATVRRAIADFGGLEIDTAGDGFFITFEGPDRALRCAGAVVRAVKPLGLEVRAGAHVGEVDLHGRSVTGLAVHVAARIMASAAPGQVVVSKPLRDLIAGSDLQSADLGVQSLKGVPGEWRLYALS